MARWGDLERSGIGYCRVDFRRASWGCPTPSSLALTKTCNFIMCVGCVLFREISFYDAGLRFAGTFFLRSCTMVAPFCGMRPRERFALVGYPG
jgi:hypothetical protein